MDGNEEHAMSLNYADGLIRKLKEKLELAQNCLQEVYDSEGLMYVKKVLDQLKE